MSTFDGIVAVLLAAGLSRRFGPYDKLEQPLDGLPLALHAGRMLRALPFSVHIAVCGAIDGLVPTALAGYGFELVLNSEPARGQGSSLALSAAAARENGATGLLVCLADMPLVSAEHIEALVERWRTDPSRIVATSGPGYIGPPALFPATLLPTLMRLDGDHGAKGLMADAVTVEADPGELRDFDTRADFGGKLAEPTFRP